MLSDLFWNKDFEEFIERYENGQFDTIVDEHLKIQKEKIRLHNIKYNAANREYVRKLNNEYSNTDEGRYATSKRNAKRRQRFAEACEDLCWAEKKLIGRFYKNCPSGYEVDHIIPLSKGGKHRLSNLQYLTKEENRQKSNSIYYQNQI